MTALPERWRVYQRCDPDERARRLKRRYQAESRRYHRAVKLKRAYRRAKIWALFAIGLGVCFWGLLLLSAWPPLTTLRHVASFPNCDAARAVGLAPAYRGQPGYWQRHDRDDDGWSCEPWPHR
jgi:hypothetical protein